MWGEGGTGFCCCWVISVSIEDSCMKALTHFPILPTCQCLISPPEDTDKVSLCSAGLPLVYFPELSFIEKPFKVIPA